MLWRSLVLLACLSGCLIGRSTVVVEPFAAPESRAQIEGFVTDLNTGEPIAGALIILTCPCLLPDIAQVEIQTQADGSYQLRDRPPGDYTVQLLVGLVTMERRVSVAAGTRARVDFRIVPEPFRTG